MATRVQKQNWTLFDVLGVVCVALTLLLSGGVSLARAESQEESLMSVDPALVESVVEREATPEPAPAPVPGAVAQGVIQLNTRGYNYGPPIGEIDPAAIALEHRPNPPASPRVIDPEKR